MGPDYAVKSFAEKDVRILFGLDRYRRVFGSLFPVSVYQDHCQEKGHRKSVNACRLSYALARGEAAEGVSIGMKSHVRLR